MTLNYSKSDRKEICSVSLVNSLLQAYFNQCNKQNTLEIKINLKTFSCKMQQKNILSIIASSTPFLFSGLRELCGIINFSKYAKFSEKLTFFIS